MLISETGYGGQAACFDKMPFLALSGMLDILAALVVALGGITASTSLYATLVQALLRAPLLFYERTPLGRVLNRVSADVAVVDFVMPFTLRSMVNCSVGLLACVGVIASTTPLFLATLPPLAVLYYFIQVTAPLSVASFCTNPSASLGPSPSHLCHQGLAAEGPTPRPPV